MRYQPDIRRGHQHGLNLSALNYHPKMVFSPYFTVITIKLTMESMRHQGQGRKIQETWGDVNAGEWRELIIIRFSAAHPANEAIDASVSPLPNSMPNATLVSVASSGGLSFGRIVLLI